MQALASDECNQMHLQMHASELRLACNQAELLMMSLKPHMAEHSFLVTSGSQSSARLL